MWTPKTFYDPEGKPYATLISEPQYHDPITRDFFNFHQKPYPEDGDIIEPWFLEQLRSMFDQNQD